MRAILERIFIFVEERIGGFQPKEGYRGSSAEYIVRLSIVTWPLAFVCIGQAFIRMLVGDERASQWLVLTASMGAIIAALPLLSRRIKSLMHLMMAIVLVAAFLACLRYFHHLS